MKPKKQSLLRLTQRRQAGFSLVEVLIAVVIIAIGLLGLAGLQATSINNGHISHLRGIVSVHTENMAELMRANPGGARANSYSTIDYSANNPEKKCRNVTVANRCTPNEQAQADAFHWIAAITRDLPAPGDGLVRGSVVCNDRVPADANPCTNGSSHTITVSWQEHDFQRHAKKQDLERSAVVNRSFATVFLP